MIMNAFGNMANNAIAAIKRIQAAINALKPKTINIPVTDNGSISRVQRNINNVRGKTVYIDVQPAFGRSKVCAAWFPSIGNETNHVHRR